MVFGTVIRTLVLGSWNDLNSPYYCTGGCLEALYTAVLSGSFCLRNPHDFSVIHSRSTPYYSCRGTGGDDQVCWCTDTVRATITQYTSPAQSKVKEALAMDPDPMGIDGTVTRIWLNAADNGKLRELKTSDWSIVQQIGGGHYGGGFGGDDEIVYSMSESGGSISRYTPFPLTYWSGNTIPGTYFIGGGGGSTDLCVASDVDGRYYYIDTGNPIYYLRDDGDDANDGLSWATAWKTMDHASRTVPEDSILFIGFGDYTVEPTDSIQSPDQLDQLEAGGVIIYRFSEPYNLTPDDDIGTASVIKA